MIKSGILINFECNGLNDLVGNQGKEWDICIDLEMIITIKNIYLCSLCLLSDKFLFHSSDDKSFSALRDSFENIGVALASFTLFFLPLFKIMFSSVGSTFERSAPKDELQRHALEIVARVLPDPTLVLPLSLL